MTTNRRKVETQQPCRAFLVVLQGSQSSQGSLGGLVGLWVINGVGVVC
jgi:hypothetical protein